MKLSTRKVNNIYEGLPGLIPMDTQAEEALSFIESDCVIEIIEYESGEIRTKEQNDKLWPMLGDISKQCKMQINGNLQKASSADWKDFFSAALINERRIAVGMDGKAILLGLSTSRMKKAKFSDLIEIMYVYGAENNVKWSEKAMAVYEEWAKESEG